MLIRRAAAALLMATFASTVAAQAPLATCGAQDACTSPAVCVTVGTAKTCYLPPTATCTVVAQENCISGVCTPGDLTCAKSANTKPCRTAGDCSATGATCTAGVCTAGEAQTPAAGAAGGACLAGRNCTTAATTFCVGQGEEAKCLLKYDQACTTATAAHCMSGTCTSEKCARSDENEGCTTNTDCTPDTLVCQRPTGAATTVAGTCKPAGAHGQPCTRAGSCTGDLLKCDASKCVLKAAVALGETCAIDADCTEGTCIKTGTAITGKCVKTIGQNCTAATDCASGLKCRDDTPKVCINDVDTPDIAEFGYCAVNEDCEAGAAFCERADAAKGVPGQCVAERSLGVQCTADTQCLTGKCSPEAGDAQRNCTLDGSTGLIKEAVNVPATTFDADTETTLPLPAGAALKLSPTAGGTVAVKAEGTKPSDVSAPPGNNVPLFLTFTKSADLAFGTAVLAFSYSEDVQAAANNIPGGDLRWSWYDETAEEWKQCADDDSNYDAETRVITCETTHFSTWTLATKSAAFAAYVPHVLTVVAATVLSLSMGL